MHTNLEDYDYSPSPGIVQSIYSNMTIWSVDDTTARGALSAANGAAQGP